jgi:AraC family transcriptional activator of tynA and feaB
MQTSKPQTRILAGSKVWSTEHVTVSQRLDYWVGAVCECFREMKIASATADFDARLESAALDTIGVNLVTGSNQEVVRSQAEIARSRSNYYYLLCDTRSEWAIEHHGATTRMRPNDLVLVDSRRNYRFHFPDDFRCTSLELPIGFVEFWLNHPQQHLGRRIDGSSGWSTPLSALVRQLVPGMAIACPIPPKLVADQLGSLLGIALQDAPSEFKGTTATDQLRQRIHDAIRERFSEPGLTATEIAAQLAISERTLHRALSGRGITFNDLLTRGRMEAARRMLTERRLDHIGIAGIGLRVGLADPSHFIRLCRRHLGATPGALRRGRFTEPVAPSR